MKYNFKQIFALGTSALLIGMTAMVGAANYPAPFVVGGSANVAIVYGTGSGVSSLDLVQAGNIQSSLQSFMTGTGGSTVTGNAASLASGSDLLYLGDELNENVETITKDDLPVALADGTFTDDGGTNYDYEQTISVLAGGVFAFGNSDNDLADPALMLTLTTTEATGLYNLTVTFDDEINFTDADSEGQTIDLFGKSYTVGTATDLTSLILLGGSDTETINIGESKTLTAGDESYAVTLNGISDADTPVASITINGETKTFTEDQTKSFAGGDVDVFVKTIFRTGENAGHVEIQLGADKLTFEDGSNVMSGSDDEEIEGTLVYFNGGTTAAMTKLTVAVAAPDNDENDLLVGESFIDSVFGSVKINFASVMNGPILDVENDVSTTRTKLSIEKGGDRELLVSATDASGNTKTIPFAYKNYTSDDSMGNVTLWEGASISEDDYFILNSGTKQHFMQMTKVNVNSAATSDVGFKDLFTGSTYSIDNKDFTGGQDITIAGQTYNVTNVSTTAVTVTSSDYEKQATGSDISVYPYIELVSGADHRFAYTDDIKVLDDFNVTVVGTPSVTLHLPTGDVVVTGSRITDTITLNVGTTKTNITVGSDNSITVGSVYYNFAVTAGAGANETDLTVAMDLTGITDGDVPYAAAGLLFVEDEDKAEATTTTENAVILRTYDAGTYSTVSTPLLTAASQNTESFDDADYTGYIDSFGTYVLYDSSDEHQEFASLTYPKTQMYADVYIAESGAAISGGVGGALGDIIVKDSEVSSVSSKNLIVVGGSCINSVAANLIGGAKCGPSWTNSTSVGSGQFLIQSFGGAYTTGKIALLVAGYDVADTVNAATYVRTQTVDTTAGKKYIGTTATQATLQVA